MGKRARDDPVLKKEKFVRKLDELFAGHTTLGPAEAQTAGQAKVHNRTCVLVTDAEEESNARRSKSSPEQQVLEFLVALAYDDEGWMAAVQRVNDVIKHSSAGRGVGCRASPTDRFCAVMAAKAQLEREAEAEDDAVRQERLAVCEELKRKARECEAAELLAAQEAAVATLAAAAASMGGGQQRGSHNGTNHTSRTSSRATSSNGSSSSSGGYEKMDAVGSKVHGKVHGHGASSSNNNNGGGGSGAAAVARTLYGGNGGHGLISGRPRRNKRKMHTPQRGATPEMDHRHHHHGHGRDHSALPEDVVGKPRLLESALMAARHSSKRSRRTSPLCRLAAETTRSQLRAAGMDTDSETDSVHSEEDERPSREFNGFAATPRLQHHDDELPHLVLNSYEGFGIMGFGLTHHFDSAAAGLYQPPTATLEAHDAFDTQSEQSEERASSSDCDTDVTMDDSESIFAAECQLLYDCTHHTDDCSSLFAVGDASFLEPHFAAPTVGGAADLLTSSSAPLAQPHHHHHHQQQHQQHQSSVACNTITSNSLIANTEFTLQAVW